MADAILAGLCDGPTLGEVVFSDLHAPDVVSVPFPIRLARIGGLGFQGDGGIITVVGDVPNLRVNFDRPMVYGGLYQQTPFGAQYEIGQPYLTQGNTVLDVPIVAHVARPTPTTIRVYADRIEVVFNLPIGSTSGSTVEHNGGPTPLFDMLRLPSLAGQTLVLPVDVREILSTIEAYGDRLEVHHDGPVGFDAVTLSPPDSAHYTLGAVTNSDDHLVLTVPLNLQLTNPSKVEGGRGSVDPVPGVPAGGGTATTVAAGTATLDTVPNAPTGGGAESATSMTLATLDRIPTTPSGGAKVV